MRKKNEDALTDEEVAFLGSAKAPDLVKQFVSRQQTSIGVRTSAYRKVAAAARAEREALLEIRLLQVARSTVGMEPIASPATPALAQPEAAIPPAMPEVPASAMAVSGD